MTSKSWRRNEWRNVCQQQSVSYYFCDHWVKMPRIQWVSSLSIVLLILYRAFCSSFTRTMASGWPLSPISCFALTSHQRKRGRDGVARILSIPPSPPCRRNSKCGNSGSGGSIFRNTRLPTRFSRHSGWTGLISLAIDCFECRHPVRKSWR